MALRPQLIPWTTFWPHMHPKPYHNLFQQAMPYVFPSTFTGSGNKLATFAGIVAAASAEVAAFVDVEARLMSQTFTLDTMTPQANPTVTALISSILSNPPTSQPQLPSGLPPSPLINMTTPQTDTTVATSAPLILPNSPTLQPQLSVALPQTDTTVATSAPLILSMALPPSPLINMMTPQMDTTVATSAPLVPSNPPTLHPQQNNTPQGDVTLSVTPSEKITLRTIQAASQR